MNFEIAPKSTETRLTWNDARLYCFSLNIDGKTDWRMPTKDELNEIYESNNDFEKTWYYWSSTEDTRIVVWSQNFCGNGNTANLVNKGNVSLYVRAIRDI